MAYRTTPNTTTGFSPSYLLHGREISLQNSENLKPKLPADKENTAVDCRLENLKSILRLAYESVKKANKESHLKNKQYYDKKAKQRNFQMGDNVYLYNRARKLGK